MRVIGNWGRVNCAVTDSLDRSMSSKREVWPVTKDGDNYALGKFQGAGLCESGVKSSG